MPREKVLFNWVDSDVEVLNKTANEFGKKLLSHPNAALHIANFKADSSAFFLGGPPFMVGDLVERLGQRSIDHWMREKYKNYDTMISSVFLTFVKTDGTDVGGHFDEMDGLILLKSKVIAEIVSIKLAPNAVAGSVGGDQDKLGRIFNRGNTFRYTKRNLKDPERRIDQKKKLDYSFSQQLADANAFGSKTKNSFYEHDRIDIQFTYKGAPERMTLEAFRAKYKPPSVAPYPVIGITTMEATKGQYPVNPADPYGVAMLGKNRTQLLELLSTTMRAMFQDLR